MIASLKHIDFRAAQRADFYIANTSETSQKIKDIYNFKEDIAIIYPPVVAANFEVTGTVGDYYLMVTRLEYYKRVDIAIEAFNQLGFKLIIVGKGTKETELKKTAKDNITFKSGLSKAELNELYAGCKALVFPQYEDFGITPLEANAAGRPVVAFGQGGVLNTMIPYKGNPKDSTAIFFNTQEPESLMQAINLMENLYLHFDPYFIRNNALRFDESNFIAAIRSFVQHKYYNHQSKASETGLNL
jgi:glycosyltransferase involved in cell wall biosynthesis